MTQEEQDKILRRLNAGVIGKRKQGTWDRISKVSTRTKSDCIKSALKYTKKSDWEAAEQTMYTAAQKYGWMDECSAHMDNEDYQDWTVERVKKTLKENFKSYKEYQEKYNNTLALKRLGMIDVVRNKFGVYKPKVTLEYAREEALKYTTRKEFNAANNRVYQWAYRNKVLDDICSHMENQRGNHLKN